MAMEDSGLNSGLSTGPISLRDCEKGSLSEDITFNELPDVSHLAGTSEALVPLDLMTFDPWPELLASLSLW